ncbi:MAG: hypothetical protein A3H98_01165 [Bacteroidetes bacterium RIFCSPLOWO2_02_FULL_36_8]|nr:MAG: hypothetical protein A3H98_01165 [Bacteroidetes bacterium RIFCSPLOWO2_02_FULL_36_8]OFY71690.1 MAG: hypothetical protein A3G23_03840 [Bacteroidetes bacterium RIFCSPLOWO2_12_FULL_37_12]
MKSIFKKGDKKTFSKKVLQEDTANFESGQVHPFYSTFAIARDAEWTGRLFVLDMKEEDEEGIGTLVKIEHKAPAFIGDVIEFTSTLVSLIGNELMTAFIARCDKKIIATGVTGQKVLKKEKIRKLLKMV